VIQQLHIQNAHTVAGKHSSILNSNFAMSVLLNLDNKLTHMDEVLHPTEIKWPDKMRDVLKRLIS